MITVKDLALRAGARPLLQGASFLISPGDRIGLVGRNGAGKTTLARVLAGQSLPEAGSVTSTGTVGYLPQGPGEADQTMTARDRILSGRGLDGAVRDLQTAQLAMAGAGREQVPLLERYSDFEDRFQALGGYGAEAEAATIAASLALPERVLNLPLAALSGGQRRRIELARILFSGADTLLLDEPTNHLDADSIAWLRDFLKGNKGGWVVISHDVSLLEATVNRVFHLDAARTHLDVYNVGWRAYTEQRGADDRRRVRERQNAEKKASALHAQADRMRYKATKARAAQNMDRRADRLLSGLAEVRRSDRVAKLRFPEPASCGRTPLTAHGLSKCFGDLQVLREIELVVERASRTVILGLNGAGKTTLLRLLAGLEKPDGGQVKGGHGLKLGYYAQEHEMLDSRRSVLANMRAAAPERELSQLRGILGSFLFSNDAVEQEVGTLSGGEKTRLALATLVSSGANVLLLDEPTNNLDPASRAEILKALATYGGAVLLVTHDEGAVDALRPERVLMLPEGSLDYWDSSFSELVALA
ncbi:MAG: ABC-F family ATP-binding cassette domain-containing protein [Candidatus Dormibacteraeota bacterium]|uniref:ABC-F family ATP-binding cassette domain-containing protein n=1 Tax=Candidatus Dormiibacter inghamiae TaxID=3127013 RepID=A0A934NB88_9BACT|nr:ABC-F family ATP-binding cassette domain-containing protein [Candidatus Dormibacteraeota bacterium]MBJ7605957.1 ABC-F family ATP-binding cassette domain-containing protein [Candidatus Dormibacteraeota bacterium]